MAATIEIKTHLEYQCDCRLLLLYFDLNKYRHKAQVLQIRAYSLAVLITMFAFDN